ncbi:MAG TPA: efflux RND transporter periplasmic adaptor subunit [Puia sp.]|uniref:efflux RND transporter periplasmic adaptor subunit n=1 Tax=Puia sp. TaxID=2045100 RepID=UPI002D1397CD|nr:efflux RND transporter periplasmic adaptor subunit [Puia sp.]HVU95580.1 efflux RND transporter periplasmic adaptor subunit [Puia sp.]
MNINFVGVVLAAMFFAACGSAAKPESKAGTADSAETGTPVTVVDVSHGAMGDYIELNAVSAFLQKSYVKAIANGYLQSADVYPGKNVEKGQVLFTMKTKEAQSIGNAIEKLDTTLHFSGVSSIRASQHGYITQLNHQSGDYVQDGEQLAVISDRSSFVFLLDLPYELRPYVLGKSSVELVLPDGTKLNGVVGAAMPTVDSASQTQNVVIRVPSAGAIPENLIAKVRILKTAKPNTQSLPRDAVLTDETESNFWVMRLIDSATAVKVPVKKGIETRDRVEILSPQFGKEDKILVTGNYGLPDTAKVKVVIGSGGTP